MEVTLSIVDKGTPWNPRLEDRSSPQFLTYSSQLFSFGLPSEKALTNTYKKNFQVEMALNGCYPCWAKVDTLS